MKFKYFSKKITRRSPAKNFQAKKRALLNVLPTGIIWSDEDGKIVFLNDAVIQLSGYEKKELFGSPVSELFPKMVRPLFFPLVDGAFPYESSVVLAKKNKHSALVNLSFSKWTEGARVFTIIYIRHFPSKEKMEVAYP